SGAVDVGDTATDFLLDPALWPVSLLAVAGAAWQWRRGNPLPGLILASALLTVPLVNAKYRLVLNARYLAPVLPVAFAAVGALLAAGYDRLSQLGQDRLRLSASAGLGQLVLDLVAVFLVLHPLVYLRA